MKDIILLGATGSIGQQVLDVIRDNPFEYRLRVIGFGKNIPLAKQIIEEFKPELVYSPFIEVTNALNYTNCTNVLSDAVNFKCDNPYVVNAIVGTDGLMASILTIEANRLLLLANKESMVIAGKYLNDLLKTKNSLIIPIDSEHSALYQLLIKHKNFKKVYITASGGALRDYSVNDLKTVSKSDVLKHPNWQMGAKITVDSATMMNKVFEIIEAHYLFNIDVSKIEAIIDRNSKIHAIVELEDGKLYPHVASCDMHLPIKYALSYPNSIDFNQTNKYLSKSELYSLPNINKLLIERYKVLKLIDYITKYPYGGLIVTCMNDCLVDLFLKDIICFSDIEDTLINNIDRFIEKYQNIEYSKDNILDLEQKIKKEVYQIWKL